MDNGASGEGWGLIGLISQLGYVVAYASSGLMADYCLLPCCFPTVYLAQSVGKIVGTGAGRGIGF